MKQQYKWNQNNTGTYVYKYISNFNTFGGAKLSHCLLFIKDEKVQKVIQLGSGYDLKYLANREAIESIYLTDLKSHHDSYYLINARFNDIWLALWEENFSLSVAYDKTYAYPKLIEWTIEDPLEYKKKIRLDGINNINRSSTELIMLSRDTKFTDNFLKDILAKYKNKEIDRLEPTP